MSFGDAVYHERRAGGQGLPGASGGGSTLRCTLGGTGQGRQTVHRHALQRRRRGARDGVKLG